MKKNLTITIIAVFLVISIFADYLFNIGILRTAGGIFTPIELVLTNTGSSVSGFFGGISNIGKLQKENSELKDKVNQLLSENALLAEAKKENESLLRELDFKKNSGLSLVPGIVTSFDPTLNSGINVYVDDVSGVKVGSAVIADGFLIGKVNQISGKKLNIALVIDSNSAIPATITVKSVTGIARGVIGNGLIFDQVPQGDSVVKGDIVTTSGLGGELPRGIIIGKVNDVQKVSGSIFQQIQLDPMVEFSKENKVLIVRG